MTIRSFLDLQTIDTGMTSLDANCQKIKRLAPIDIFFRWIVYIFSCGGFSKNPGLDQATRRMVLVAKEVLANPTYSYSSRTEACASALTNLKTIIDLNCGALGHKVTELQEKLRDLSGQPLPAKLPTLLDKFGSQNDPEEKERLKEKIIRYLFACQATFIPSLNPTQCDSLSAILQEFDDQWYKENVAKFTIPMLNILAHVAHRSDFKEAHWSSLFTQLSADAIAKQSLGTIAIMVKFFEDNVPDSQDLVHKVIRSIKNLSLLSELDFSASVQNEFGVKFLTISSPKDNARFLKCCRVLSQNQVNLLPVNHFPPHQRLFLFMKGKDPSKVEDLRACVNDLSEEELALFVEYYKLSFLYSVDPSFLFESLQDESNEKQMALLKCVVSLWPLNAELSEAGQRPEWLSFLTPHQIELFCKDFIYLKQRVNIYSGKIVTALSDPAEVYSYLHKSINMFTPRYYYKETLEALEAEPWKLWLIGNTAESYRLYEFTEDLLKTGFYPNCQKFFEWQFNMSICLTEKNFRKGVSLINSLTFEERNSLLFVLRNPNEEKGKLPGSEVVDVFLALFDSQAYALLSSERKFSIDHAIFLKNLFESGALPKEARERLEPLLFFTIFLKNLFDSRALPMEARERLESLLFHSTASFYHGSRIFNDPSLSDLTITDSEEKREYHLHRAILYALPELQFPWIIPEQPNQRVKVRKELEEKILEFYQQTFPAAIPTSTSSHAEQLDFPAEKQVHVYFVSHSTEAPKACFASLFNNELFSDITLVFCYEEENDEKEKEHAVLKIKAHKAVLCATSSYFHKMFTSDMKENEEPEIALEMLHPSAIEYLYTGEMPNFTDEESKAAFLAMLDFLNPP